MPRLKRQPLFASGSQGHSSGSGVTSKDIADAFASGSATFSQNQQAAQAALSASLSASIAARQKQDQDDDNTSDALVQSLPGLIQNAVANGHTFISLMEFPGGDFAVQDTLPGAHHKLLSKVSSLGLRATITRVVGPTSASFVVGVRLD